jgi:dTDP-4-dehydrorhamnose reductase
MKILLLGANGQVGFELQRVLAPLGDLLVATRDGKLAGGVNCLRGDLGDAASLDKLLDSVQCNIVVNAAAYTAVDRAEDEPALAERINGEALAQLGAWARSTSALVVHYSTDYVFDGQGKSPYREEDATAPLGIYGGSKLRGERALRDSGCAYLILRTAWVYGARGSNFLRTMLRLANERDRLTVVDDQYGAPTSSRLIAATTLAVLKRWIDSGSSQRSAYNGVYHLAAAGCTSWCGFAKAIVERAEGAKLVARAPEVAAIGSAEFKTKARRPAYSVLDTTRLRETFDIHLPDWTQGLDTTIAELADLRFSK